MKSLNAESVVGRQRPRVLHSPRLLFPNEKFTSAGQEVCELAASAGLILDPWQEFVLDHSLTERADGRWTAREIAIVVSRQNGKGSILEALELADLFLLDNETHDRGESLTIHSAHWFPTSQEALRRLRVLIEQSPDLDRMFSACRGKIRESNGKEGIEMYRDGKWRRLKFQTRTKSGGRGLSGDRVVIDEAMIYDAEMDSALRPTMSAMWNPQMWLLGSAGDRFSTIFGKARARGIEGKDPRLCYFEWSIDPCSVFCAPDCTEHDPVDERLGYDRLLESYAKANPGLGIRIPVEAVESERSSMDKEMFARERLGVGDWPVEGDAWRIIDKDSWMLRADESSSIAGNFVLAVDTTPGQTPWTCLGVAGRNDEGLTHVEIPAYGMDYDHRPGTSWVVERVVQIWKADRPLAVVIDKATQAGTFIPELEAAGVKVISPLSREYAQSCGDFYTGIIPGEGNEPSLVHIDQEPLNSAIAGADTRKVLGMWAWDRLRPSDDISPLNAVTLALWGYTRLANKKRPRAKAAWG